MLQISLIVVERPFISHCLKGTGIINHLAVEYIYLFMRDHILNDHETILMDIFDCSLQMSR